MSAPTLTTPQQAVLELSRRLDDALRLAGLDPAPALAALDEIAGVKSHRIRPAALATAQGIELTEVLGGRVFWADTYEVARALDAALRGAGILAPPSRVVWGTAGNRIIPPWLSFGQTEQLVKTIMQGARQ
ncbi:hypothetical protein [Streptomyces sp. NPDC001657]|uniref:hypothetical protein n=1 Tax=Streptomyces sp. NPDC001657 TaxID=3154522 RepID=UPI003321C651